MTWQKQARIGVAILGLGCAAAVYFMSGERRTTPPPRPPERLRDEQATSESSNCEWTRYKDEVKSYVLHCDHLANYAGGRSRAEKIKIETTRDDESYVILADVAEWKGQAASGADDPGEVALTGHVRIDTSKGLTILSDAATYVDSTGMVTIPDKVTFTRDRLSGNGVGATYNRGTSTLLLQHDAHVAMAPDKDGGGAFNGTSESLMLVRTQKYLRLDQRASIVRDRETMNADVAQLFFTEDEQNLQRIDLRGNSSVEPRGDRTTAPPEMRADDITLSFHPNSRAISQSTLENHATLVQTTASGQHTIVAGWIDAHTGRDGQTLTGLDAKIGVSVALPKDDKTNTPARTITANALNAQGTEKDGLTAARFDGGPKLVEFIEIKTAGPGQSGSVTNGWSQTLVLTLSGGFDGIDEARFSQRTRFTKDKMEAKGDLGTYNAKKQTLLLEPATKPEVPLYAEDGRVTVDARGHILLHLDNENLTADGSVQTTMRPAADGKNGPAKSGLFEAGKSTTGYAEQFRYEDGRATYIGTAREVATVSQEGSRVDADRIEVWDQSGDLRATGRVKSSIMMDDTKSAVTKTPSAASPKQSPKTASAQKLQVATGKTLVYRDSDRKATYTGDDADPATLTGDTIVKAVRIDIYLAKDQRTADRMEADGDAHAWLDKREFRGDHLQYVSATGKYVLTGTPAQVKEPNDVDPKGCRIAKAKTVEYKTGGVASFDPGYSSTADQQVPCSVTLAPKSQIK